MGITFSSSHIEGSGRGKSLGFATINLDPYKVPTSLPHGMFAARATIGDTNFDAVLHFGERPTFRDSLSCEVHLLDIDSVPPPPTVTVHVIKKLRDVMEFQSPEDLKVQISKDIEQTKLILSREPHDS